MFQIPFWRYDFKGRTEGGTSFRHWRQPLKGNIEAQFTSSINKRYSGKVEYIIIVSLSPQREIRECQQVRSMDTSQSQSTEERRSHVSRPKSAITNENRALSYSPELSLTDYHLFCSLQNFLNGKTFNSVEEASQAIENVFWSKPSTF